MKRKTVHENVFNVQLYDHVRFSIKPFDVGSLNLTTIYKWYPLPTTDYTHRRSKSFTFQFFSSNVLKFYSEQQQNQNRHNEAHSKQQQLTHLNARTQQEINKFSKQ